MKRMLLVAVMLIVTMFFMVSPAYAIQFEISGDNHIGCKDKDYIKKLLKEAKEGDESAVINDVMLGKLSGECAALENGLEVSVTDISAISEGLVKIRKSGSTSEFWIPAPWLTEKAETES